MLCRSRGHRRGKGLDGTTKAESGVYRVRHQHGDMLLQQGRAGIVQRRQLQHGMPE